MVRCNRGYSPDPRMRFPFMLYCREGFYKLYVAEIKEWVAFTKAPACVGKVSGINKVAMTMCIFLTFYPLLTRKH